MNDMIDKEAEMKERIIIKNNGKQLYFRLCPELVDGYHWTFVPSKEQVLEAVATWVDEVLKYGCRDSINIDVEEMTFEEIEALPEI